ncbi:MAG: Smr/MutS family protein [Clostridia bacterium]
MFNVGDYVKILDTNIYGFIFNIIKDKCIIKSNNKTITTKLSDIEKAKKPIKNRYLKPKTQDNIFTITLNENNTFEPEIMLRHQHVSEAILNLENFIDQAILNKETYIKIIHGKSGGIIRKIVHEYLDKCQYIESYRLGYIHEGSYRCYYCKIKIIANLKNRFAIILLQFILINFCNFKNYLAIIYFKC